MTADGGDRPLVPDGGVAGHHEPGDPTARFRQNPALLSRSLPDGVLLLAPGQAEPVALVGSGGDLWARLARPCTYAEVVAHLAARYDTDPATVDHDVAAVWHQLVALDAVVTA